MLNVDVTGRRYALYISVPMLVFTLLGILNLLSVNNYVHWLGYALFIPMFVSKPTDNAPGIILFLHQLVLEITFVANAVGFTFLLVVNRNYFNAIFNAVFFVAVIVFLALRWPEGRRRRRRAK